MLAALFDLPELMIPLASVDAAAEGQAASISFTWADQAFVGWKPGSAGLNQPSAGYIFTTNTPNVRRWRDEDRNGSEVVEVSRMYIPKVVSSLSGFLINNIE
jgi:hypothetical protein